VILNDKWGRIARFFLFFYVKLTKKEIKMAYFTKKHYLCGIVLKNNCPVVPEAERNKAQKQV
jgi:hypothetical protein